MSLEESDKDNNNNINDDDNDYNNNDYNKDEIKKIISDEVGTQLSFFHKKMEKIEKDNEKIENKLNLIIELLEGRIDKQCSKMGEHIDFVENVYENVKNPLGFICNKLNKYIGPKTKYSLIKNKDSPEKNKNICLGNENLDNMKIENIETSIGNFESNHLSYDGFVNNYSYSENETVIDGDYI